MSFRTLPPPPLLRVSSRRPKHACAALDRAKRGLATSTMRGQPPAGRAGSQLDKPSARIAQLAGEPHPPKRKPISLLDLRGPTASPEHAASGEIRAVSCKPQAQAAGLRPSAVGPARPVTQAAVMLSAAHALDGPKPAACRLSMD